ncbi:MAG: adenosyl-hopene transferase HpnH [Candidatus Brocadiales bacterium]|nr:adenosyl-hopene transferase HpnH [Candidatus Bathyanammoxibius amoris]
MRVPVKLGTSLTGYLLKNRLASREKFPLVLMLEPTHLCNLSCKGCGRIIEYSDNSDLLSVEECLGAAEECGAPVVTVTGGEPLLHPQVDEIVKGLVDMGRYIYLCTNGLLLTGILDKFEPSSHFNINVHIDGLEETHNAITLHEDSFKEAVEAIKEAKKLGFRVCTNTTLYLDTKPEEIEELFAYLEGIGIDGMLVSPGFGFVHSSDDIFLTREQIQKRFGFIYELSKRYRLLNTPLYLKFLTGQKKLKCTPWGNPTRNTLGWKSPCYLITDKHYPTYKELMDNTDWEYYRSGKDPRCKNCMMHCGFEASVILEGINGISDMMEMARWSFT